MRNDDAYANAKYIPEGAEYPPRWAARAAGFRVGLGARARLGLRYGTAARHWFDLFLPEAAPEGLIVFIHGGYWLRLAPTDFSHLAAGSLARGWAVAMPAYTLAPEAGLPQIAVEIGTALAATAAEVPGPLRICGHSAGGHLTARMAAMTASLAPDLAARVVRYMPISPLSDLRPLMQTTMNADLRIDDAVAANESPALLPMRGGAKVHVWVGGAERPAFLDQARWLGQAWSCPVTVEPARHHFDVIEGLEAPDSPLMQSLLA